MGLLRRTAGVCALAVLAVGLASFSSAAVRDETTIVVATSSDALNGDASSVPALLASPGPDGISLREAIQATNNDPGSYAIRFDAGLAGRTIDVHIPLPALSGGGVSIDGDITGDGRPDVTLRRRGVAGMLGLTISSGGNTLHAIALQGFGFGAMVRLAPLNKVLPSGQTYSGNTLSRLVITGGENGIGLVANGHNRWLDTRIVDNTMTVTGLGMGHGGVSVHIIGAAGRAERVTITGNTIRLAGAVPERGRCLTGGIGISVSAGEGAGDVKDDLSDVLIARNSISGNPDMGIVVGPGGSGVAASTVERVRILDNRVDLPEERRGRCLAIGDVRQEIVLMAGDDNRTHTRENDNVLSDVEVSRNWLATGEGVRVFAGSGGARNAVRHLRITGNSIHVIGPFPGVDVHGCEGGTYGTTTGSRISDVTIDANRITIVKDDPTQTPGIVEGLGPRNLCCGGIYVAAAAMSGIGPVTNARVEDVRITKNRVDTHMIGISLVGGFGGSNPARPATRSVLFNVVIAGNIVPRAPQPLALFTPETRGINLAGGIDDASGNRVACVRVSGNRVAGVRDAVSLIDNSDGATGNRASLGGC